MKKDKKYENNKSNKMICPIREYPIGCEEDTLYIIHFRNPIDILISEYYSFGYTHAIPNKTKGGTRTFLKRREKIQSQTVSEYCNDINNIKEINNKFDSLLTWIKKYGKRKNVFLSNYDSMFYKFKSWNNKIHQFLNFNCSNNIHELFYSEFDFNKDYDKSLSEEILNIKNISNGNKYHKRSGVSKQYLFELNKKSLFFLQQNLSTKIIEFFNPF